MRKLKYTLVCAALIVGAWLVLPASAQNYLCGAINGQPFCNVLLFGDGTVIVPSMAFVSNTDTGIAMSATGDMPALIADGTIVAAWRDDTVGAFIMKSDYPIGWSSGTPGGSGADVTLFRDAANTSAQRNGTANQTSNNYARRVSATEFNRTASKDISTAVTAAVGATVTATNLIPDGCALVSVTTSVTTGLGVSTGTTGYSVGDGSDPDRWGTVVGTAAGTDTDNTDWTVTTVQLFTAAQNVVLTATGGNFDGTGVIQTHVGCLVGEAE